MTKCPSCNADLSEASIEQGKCAGCDQSLAGGANESANDPGKTQPAIDQTIEIDGPIASSPVENERIGDSSESIDLTVSQQIEDQDRSAVQRSLEIDLTASQHHEDLQGDARLGDSSQTIDLTVSQQAEIEGGTGAERSMNIDLTASQQQEDQDSDSRLGDSSQTIDLTLSQKSDDVTLDAPLLSEDESHALGAMWKKGVDDGVRQDMTIRLDATVTSGASSLVVRKRELRESHDEQVSTADYELLNVIGEGGMGVVYAARQASIDRTVAIKMLKTKAAGEEHRSKFISEAVVTGELDHPNIVPIYDLGTNAEGALFYSMKRVKGTPWVEVHKNKSLTENIEILMKVADAVAFAHANGVIHRDLKPENVMLGDFGEVLVMDWGLAVATAEFRNLDAITQTSSMGGTPAYMAPEMATGPIEKVGRASDIYLLGGILYEIITGKLPHTGKDVMGCLTAAARNDIQPTGKSGELLDIGMHAMATSPADRYASVQEFQTAIREYQSHSESIALSSRAAEDLQQATQTADYQDYARSLYGFQEAVALWEGNEKARTGLSEAKLAYAGCAMAKGDFELGLSLLDAEDPAHVDLQAELEDAQRERESRQSRLKMFKGAAAVLVAAILIVITVSFFLVRADRNRAIVAERTADQKRVEADDARVKAEAATERAESERQRAESEKERAQREKQRADEEKDRADEQRVLAVDAKEKAIDAKEAEEYETYVARIGLASAKIDENAFDSAIAILDRCKPEMRHWEWGRLRFLCQQSVETFRTGGPVDAVAYSPSQDHFATASWDGKAIVWDARSGKELLTIEPAQYVHAVTFSPDGKLLATGSSNRKAQLWSLEDGAPVRSFEGHEDSVLSVSFSRDGSRLLTTSYDKTARIWDAATGKELQVLQGHNWWVWDAAFSPDEKNIVTAGQDGKAIIWARQGTDTDAKFEKSADFRGHQGPVYAVSYAPDGSRVATAGFDKRVLLWDPATIKPIDIRRRLDGQPDPAMDFRVLEGHTAAVRSVQFSDNGKLLLTGGQDNTIRVWDAANLMRIKVLRGHGQQVRSCVFSHDAQSVLSGSHDHQAKLWSIAGYQEVRVLQGKVLSGHADAVLGSSFSPDHMKVVTASRDRTAKTWSFETGKPLHEFKEGHEFLATAAVFFPGGKRMLTSAGDNTVRVWDVATGAQTMRLDHTGRSGAAALSHNGKWIVSGSDRKSAMLWDAESGQLIQELKSLGAEEAHLSDVTTVAFSGDDRTLFTGDSQGKCRVWRWTVEASQWQVVQKMDKHGGTITGAVFLPDGKTILTASGDKSVAQWNVESGQESLDLTLRHPDWVSSLSLSPDGRRVLTSCEDGKVRLWEVADAKLIKTLEQPEEKAGSVMFSPDGRSALAVSSSVRTVRLWDLESGNQRHDPTGEDPQGPFLDLKKRGGLLWSAVFSEDGAYLVTVGGSGARLWSVETGKESMSFSPSGAIASANFSPDGSRIVTGSWDNAAKIWDVESGNSVLKLAGGHLQYVNSAVFSPNGKMVLTASDDATAQLWNAQTGKLLGVSFEGHEARIRSATFSADAAKVLTASNDKTARIWDARTGDSQLVLSGHKWAVLCAEFSRDGACVITGSEDNTARIWDARTGEVKMILQGHTAGIAGVAFSPDGERALTASQDNTAKLWDARTGKELLTLKGHSQALTSVQFSGDGQYVLTSSRDGTAIIWLASGWDEARVAP